MTTHPKRKARGRSRPHPKAQGAAKGKGRAPSAALPEMGVLAITDVDLDGEMRGRPLDWPDGAPLPEIRIIVERGAPALGVGERAVVRYTRLERGQYEARIIRAVAPAPDRVLGIYRRNRDGGRLEPTDRKTRTEFKIAPADSAGAEDGEIVLAEITAQRRFGLPDAKIVERIGDSADPRAFSLFHRRGGRRDRRQSWQNPPFRLLGVMAKTVSWGDGPRLVAEQRSVNGHESRLKSAGTSFQRHGRACSGHPSPKAPARAAGRPLEPLGAVAGWGLSSVTNPRTALLAAWRRSTLFCRRAPITTMQEDLERTDRRQRGMERVFRAGTRLRPPPAIRLAAWCSTGPRAPPGSSRRGSGLAVLGRLQRAEADADGPGPRSASMTARRWRRSGTAAGWSSASASTSASHRRRPAWGSRAYARAGSGRSCASSRTARSST